MILIIISMSDQKAEMSVKIASENNEQERLLERLLEQAIIQAMERAVERAIAEALYEYCQCILTDEEQDACDAFIEGI